MDSPVTSRRDRLVGILVAATAGPPLVGGLLASLLHPEETPLLLPVALGVAGGLLVLLGRGGGRHRAGLVVACCSIIVVLGWPEVGLRLAGLPRDGAGQVEFGYPRPDSTIRLERDPQLFWKLPADLPGANSAGLPGPEIPESKPEGLFRLVFLGDSCTAQGYPRQGLANVAVQLLEQYAGATRRYEAVNLSLFGYSSYQGRVLAQRWVERLRPDVGLIYYGWNDHWQAYGAPDRDKAGDAEGDGESRGGIARIARASHLVRWLSEQVAPARARPIDQPRVSPDDYRANLAFIGGEIERAGGAVILLTAPSSHERLGVPPYLVEEGFAPTSEQVTARHARYNEITRSVAREHGWLLLDLQAAVKDLDDLHEIFREDGIHFTPRGLRWVGTKVAEIVYRQVLEKD